jgi:hypothetical protein
MKTKTPASFITAVLRWISTIIAVALFVRLVITLFNLVFNYFAMVQSKQLERAAYACTCGRRNIDLCMARSVHGARVGGKDHYRSYWHDLLYWQCDVAAYHCGEKAANFHNGLSANAA